MTIFESIRYKNFIGSGEAWIDISLNKNPSTLIIGTNGAGKTTFLDALAFAWFGRAFRNINKDQLVNSINEGNTVVESIAINNGHRYKVCRGLKPTVFEIFEDDKLIPQNALNKDYQNIIETNILKMNFKAFTQIVMIGIDSYTPFMKLTAPNRRAVIEDLLDIQVFSDMNSILKKKMTANKDDITEINKQIELAEQKTLLHKQHLEALKFNNEGFITTKRNKITENNQYIEDAHSSILVLKNKIKNLDKIIQEKSSLVDKKNEYYQYEIKITDKIYRLGKELLFFEENTECPTCSQNINIDISNKAIDERKNKINELQDGITELQKELDLINDKLEVINKKNIEATDMDNEVSIMQNEIKAREHHNDELDKEIFELLVKKPEINESELLSLKSNLIDLHTKKEELIIEKNTQELANILLSDSGIKSKIIGQYIPIMNKLINKYLASMDFMIQFQLDETFNETILSRFRDNYKFDSFSAGEKLRINLALLFTWREIAKIRNSASTNLLIMDEVFDSSLDITGTDELLKILQSLTNDTNSYIISHRSELVDKFSNILTFEKTNNFSRIVEDSIL